uniref:Uncharacterized protein n=1 Tax=Rhizophora mucronata TaxID=61149 RepID=A0A2P2NJ88_RHIMU
MWDEFPHPKNLYPCKMGLICARRLCIFYHNPHLFRLSLLSEFMNQQITVYSHTLVPLPLFL